MSTLSFNVDNNQKEILLRKISEIIDRFKIKSILDIGAGHPILVVPVSKRVDKYIGVETEPNRVKLLREAGLKIVEGEFPNIEIKGSFDLVLSSHSIPEQISDYPQFLQKAWGFVKENGWLVIITFKGVEDDLENLINILRKNWTDNDKPKYDEMMKILSTFGEVSKEKVTSQSSSEDIEQMTNLLSFSIGGSGNEKSSYHQKLKDILNEKYKTGGKFIFPHKHFVLMVQKLK